MIIIPHRSGDIPERFENTKDGDFVTRRGTPYLCRRHRGFSGFTDVPLLMRDRNRRSAGILFSVLPEKSMQKRGAGREIALTREKACRSTLRVIVTLLVKERPSGDRPIGFPERTVRLAYRSVCAR